MNASFKHRPEPLPKLELDKKRYRVKFCPCGKSNKDGKFVPYVGHENKGYCHSCGETFLPELPKVEQWNTPQRKAYQPRPVTPQPKPVSFIPIEVFKASLNGHEANNFVKYLIEMFGVEVASELVSRYFIGTSKHQFERKAFPNYKSEKGATVFWQIDTLGNVRTGKIMLYSPTTGKRVKEPFNHINWVHIVLRISDFQLKQCFFGEHLLKDKTKPVAIVESEKTAVIASVYLPQFIWLAAGSKDGLNIDKCSILKGRTVVLFPDLNGFDKWYSKSKELSHIAVFTLSDLLERKATEGERKQGLDLADYLLRFDYKEFVLPEPEAKEPPPATMPHPAVQPLAEERPYKQPEPVFFYSKPIEPYHKSWEQEISETDNWEKDIADLEKYFAGIEVPAQPVKLNPHSTITNYSLFIHSHFATVKANSGGRTFLPFLNRLQGLRQYLNEKAI